MSVTSHDSLVVLISESYASPNCTSLSLSQGPAHISSSNSFIKGGGGFLSLNLLEMTPYFQTSLRGQGYKLSGVQGDMNLSVAGEGRHYDGILPCD